MKHLDDKAVYTTRIGCDDCHAKIRDILEIISEVTDIVFQITNGETKFIEFFLEQDISGTFIKDAIKSLGKYQVQK